MQWSYDYWQIYEITGLGINDTPVITKIPNQPENFNNIAPIYGTDDRIIFESDRPRNGARHLYPQHDEYESTPIVFNISSTSWSLGPKCLNAKESVFIVWFWNDEFCSSKVHKNSLIE